MSNHTQSVLYKKIYGSLVASAAGDAMGGPVEGLDWDVIEAEFGRVTDFMPYTKLKDVIEAGDLHGAWDTTAGSITDDTRFRNLLCEVIIEKGETPTRGDFAKGIAEYYFHADDDVAKGFMEEYFLKTIYGERMQIWGGQPVSAALMMNSPIGLIHPCDPTGAYQAAQEIAFISEGYAQTAANIVAASVAAAMVPNTNVDAIISAALRTAGSLRVQGPHFIRWKYGPNVGQPVERLIEEAISIAHEIKDVFEIRAVYYERLNYLPIMVDAAQAIAVSLGMLVAADGDPQLALHGAVNYGRDCDTYASVVGALVGALHGIDALPAEWAETIAHVNPEPNLADLAAGLTQVAEKRILSAHAIADKALKLLN